MPDPAALVTGASSGIGLAIAHAPGEECHGLTVAARRPEKLAHAVEELRAAGHEVEEVAANLTAEEDIQRVVAAHRERFGRLDVLVNSAGVGFGAPAGEHQTKRVDMQLDLNLRAIAVESVVPCPGFVDTPMTDFIKQQVSPDEMISTRDVAEAVRFLLRLSPACIVPEIVFQRPSEGP